MLKIRDGFYLQKVSSAYMVVTVGAASKRFNGIIRMNETGAFYWRLLEKGITKQELVQKTLAHFGDLDEATANTDIQEYLDSISVALEEI